MHVVIVDEELPYPLNSGKRIRIFNLLRHLSRRHRLTLICHPNPDRHELTAAEERLQELGIETIVVEPSGAARLAHASRLATPMKLAVNQFSKWPYSVQWHRCANLERAVRQYGLDHAVDLWQCEWAPYASNFLKGDVGPWVMMAHDVQCQIWRRHLQAEKNPLKRLLIAQQQRRYQRYEVQVFGDADLTLTVTEQDAVRVRDEFGAYETDVVENGVDVASYQAVAAELGPEQRQRSQILFVGNLEWRPNTDAAQMLVEEVLPQVRHEEPQAELLVVGRRPPRWLQTLCEATSHVALHADVPDVREFYCRCGMLAVPLRFASGSRLKILEALATGTPVVSSEVGAEGLRLDPGQHFASANDAATMARAIVDWIRHPQQADALAAAGQRVVEACYDWSVLADQMETAWQRLVDSRQAGEPQKEASVLAGNRR